MPARDDPPMKRIPESLRRVFAGLASAALVACSVGFAATADARPESDVLRVTLSNGLQVVVVRNSLAPVVSVSVSYLVGSDEAPAGFPGMAHAQEHMMFRGSPGLDADQLADIGSVMGGNFNANTREGMTQYEFTVPAEDLEVALHIEATRMRAVLDTRKDWDQERGAIEQEVAQDVSQPGYVLYSKIREAMFAGTPYAHDALGTRQSFDRTTADMLKRFHDAWYAPNNAILVIAGDVSPAATLREVKHLFGDIAPKHLPARPAVNLRPVEPVELSLATRQPTGTLMLAWRTPGPRSADFPALEVLADVLSSHRSGLYELVPKGKAVGAAFGLDPLPQAGLALAAVSFTAAQDPKALEGDVRGLLADVVRRGVTPELVEAAKIQERTQAQFQRNSIADLASVWSDAVALYGLRSPDEDLDRIERVTVEDVNRVARKYLDLSHTVCGVMRPSGSGKPVPVSTGRFGGQESISLGEAKPTPLPDWAQAALHELVVPRSTLHPVVSRLPNGITLIVQPEAVSDTVSVFGHVRNRPETQEPAGQEGIDQVVEQLLSYGSERLDRLAFQQALDAIGANEKAGTEFSVQSLAEHFDEAVALLAANELHPALPGDALSIVKQQLAQEVAALDTSPGFQTQRSLRQALFPAGDPMLRVATSDTVNALTLDEVRSYHQRVYRPDLTTIVVIGKVSPEQARAVIEKHFGDWSASGPTPDVDLPPTPLNRPDTIVIPDAGRAQTSVILGEDLGITRTSPDYYALELGNAVLGGGFYSTRLSIDLRKNAGLVYSVGSALQAGRTRSVYFIQFASDPGNAGKAASIAIQEIRAMQAAPAGPDELSRAKALLVRQIPLGESGVEEIAQGFLERSDLGLPLDEPISAARRYIALGAEDVQAAFRKWMRPQDLVRVSEGPISG